MRVVTIETLNRIATAPCIQNGPISTGLGIPATGIGRCIAVCRQRLGYILLGGIWHAGILTPGGSASLAVTRCNTGAVPGILDRGFAVIKRIASFIAVIVARETMIAYFTDLTTFINKSLSRITTHIHSAGSELNGGAAVLIDCRPDTCSVYDQINLLVLGG